MMELLDPTQGYLWLAVGIVLSILEALVPGASVFLGMGIACVLTSVFAFLGVSSLKILVLIFAGLTLVSFFAIRSLAARFLYGKESVETNTSAMIGKHGRVMQPIGGRMDPGYVKLQGEEWRAISDEAIPENTDVEVLKVEGVTLTVTPCENKDDQ